MVQRKNTEMYKNINTLKFLYIVRDLGCLKFVLFSISWYMYYRYTIILT